MAEDELTIQAITRLTGVNEHTLRAWERRYGAVRPRRTATGRRYYRRSDVERLRRLRSLVERGAAIGRIARLTDQELGELLADGEAGGGQTAADTTAASGLGELATAVHAAALAFKIGDMHALLTAARSEVGARHFGLELISPLMAAVGRHVMAGRMSIAQEHALSAVVRAHLYGLLYELVPPQGSAPGARPVVAVASMEGNLHEIGILIAAILAALRGYSPYYLGPNLPAPALAEAARALTATHVIIGAIPVPPGILPQKPVEYLRQLDRGLDPSVRLWVGGADLSLAGMRDPHRRIHFIPTLPDLDLALANGVKADPDAERRNR